MVKNKKFAIVTASDAKYGDFLINHWLKSLQENVNIKEIDIIVLDYGFNKKQKEILRTNKARIIDCTKDGNVVNIRYRDMLKFFRKNKYCQILTVDGGDVIFQRDISFLFYKDKNQFRAVVENSGSRFNEYLVERSLFSEDMKKEILKTISGKPLIYGGLMFAPYNKFVKLCENMNDLIRNKKIYGPDMTISTYTCYKLGFVALNPTFDYVINDNPRIKIRDGVFYDKNNEMIYVVHNAGGGKLPRSVKNFGFGPQYNQFSWITYVIARTLIKIKLFSVMRILIKAKNLFFS